MPLIVHLHPLSSFCHKVLMALYENGTPFTPRTVDLTDAEERAAFRKISPFGKIPALEDTDRNEAVFETTIMLDYLQQHYPGPVTLIPADPDAAREVRLWDRIIDNYLHHPMQRVVAETFRPQESRDPYGAEEARQTIRAGLDLLERRLSASPHPGGAAFSMADCAAAPALFYLQAIEPFAETHPHVGAYFERLSQRPAFVRLHQEAKPFLQFFPLVERLPARFRA